MTSREQGRGQPPGVWVLCGVGLGLLLVLGRWWSLHAEGEDLQREVRRIEAEWEELEPVVQEVKELKARRDSLESLISDFLRRHKLFQVAAGALRLPEPGVALEGLDVRGFEVEILAQADDERAVRRWIETLEKGGGFQAGGDAALEEAPESERFIVRGELLLSGMGGEE